jgi:prephenate dehydrogenase
VREPLYFLFAHTLLKERKFIMLNLENTNSSCFNKLKRFRITIVGTGLIGGSLALALNGFKNAVVTGADIDKDSLKQALAAGAIDEAAENTQEAIAEADLVILCVSPRTTMKIIKEQKGNFKKGCVITDVCGTKHNLYRDIPQYIPESVEYIGIHPMAGKEVGGFVNACADLFQNTGFILIPLQTQTDKGTALMLEIAQYIGAKYTALTNPETHDDIIAYTSDLMHIAAGALCMDFHPQTAKAYTAGAFRDCTRIANMDAELWTELLICNGEKIVPHLENYINNLRLIKTAMQNKDTKAVHELLARASNNKKELLLR